MSKNQQERLRLDNEAQPQLPYPYYEVAVWAELETEPDRDVLANFAPEDAALYIDAMSDPIQVPDTWRIHYNHPDRRAMLATYKRLHRIMSEEKVAFRITLTRYDGATRHEERVDQMRRRNPGHDFLSLSTVKRFEKEARDQGVSKVARSPRGFLTAYKRAGGAAGLSDEWKQKRENFIARHMAQAKSEPLFKNGRPTRRHLALIMWAYSPQASKLPKSKPKDNPGDSMWITKARFTVDWEEVERVTGRRGRDALLWYAQKFVNQYATGELVDASWDVGSGFVLEIWFFHTAWSHGQAQYREVCRILPRRAVHWHASLSYRQHWDAPDQLLEQKGTPLPNPPRANPGDILVENFAGAEPDDIPDAIRSYEGFNAARHNQVQRFSNGGAEVPRTMIVAGPALHVLYQSSKWGEPRPVDYIHEITSKGYVVCALSPSMRSNPPNTGAEIVVPRDIRYATTVAQIGERALGYAYQAPDGSEIEVECDRRTKWYWSPVAKAMYLIRGTEVLGLFWGGRLDVEPRGIVG